MHRYKVAKQEVLDLMAKSIQKGMSVEKLLADLSLPSDMLSDENSTLYLDDCWRLMIGSQNAIQEESHLMSLRPLKKGTTRLIFTNLSQSVTLEEGLITLAETYNIVHGGDYNFVRRRGSRLSFIVDDENFHYSDTSNHFAIEFALIRIHAAVSLLAGQQLQLLNIKTKRNVLPSYDHHLNVFNCPVVVKHKHYELCYDAAQFELPLASTSPDVTGNIFEAFLGLGELLPEQALKEKLKLLVKEFSGQQQLPSQEVVAKQLNMSVATLRRKLQVEGCSFREVLDECHKELAANLLQDGLSIQSTSEQLGYSDVRSFKRAFKRWHQLSPAAYLKK